MEKELKDSIIIEMKPIREGMKNLPKAITFSQFPSITAKEDDDEEDETKHLGDIPNNTCDNLLLHQALIEPLDCGKRRASFFIGNKEARIKENNLLVVKNMKVPPGYGR